MQEAKDDDDHRGVYSKSQGQLGRVALVCHGLYHAVDYLSNPQDQPFEVPNQISDEIMDFAAGIMRLGIAHKFALMPPPITNPLEIDQNEPTHPAPPAVDNNDEEDLYTDLTDARVASRVNSLLTYGLEVIEPSKVAQRKLMPPLKNPPPNANSNKPGNKYPVDAARRFLHLLAKAGLGDMVDKPGTSKGAPRRVVQQFHKRKYNELSADAVEIVKKLKITEKEYTYIRDKQQ